MEKGETKSFLIGVGIGLVILLVYFLYVGFEDYKSLYEEIQYNQTINEAFVNGTIYGSNVAVAQILQQAITCQDVPVRFGNETYILIWKECLG